MEQVVIGCDPDSKLFSVVVTINDKLEAVRQKRLPDNVPVSRRNFVVMKWIRSLCREYGGEDREVHFFIEAPFVSPKTIRAAIPLGRLNGSALSGALDGGAITSQDIVIQSWKKEIVGNGNSTKQQIARWAKECWPAVYDKAAGRQDLLDAAGINRYGMKLLERAAYYGGDMEEPKPKRRPKKIGPPKRKARR
jgi:Holliday junction resolvasome RuvABC endonuclease subunit